MTPNDVKKGTTVLNPYGEECIIQDNRKGDVRAVDAPNAFNNTLTRGTMYAIDIRAAKIDGEWVRMEYTPKMIEGAQMRSSLGL